MEINFPSKNNIVRHQDKVVTCLVDQVFVVLNMV